MTGQSVLERLVFRCSDRDGMSDSISEILTVKMERQYDKVPRPRGDASDTGAHHICQPAF